MKPLGTVLDGKLRLDRLLGQGGMGAVYLATHLVLGQRVAVKVLSAEDRRSPEVLARFVQEAQVASRIASEHVVRVFDLGQSPDGEPYIVMELLEGEDLAQVLERERRLPVATAVGLVLQSCLGVAAAHAAGLVHRDLKPANLFATRRSAGGVLVKVLDFGLSKIVSADAPRLTQSSVTFGTPLYMAPEQILSAKHVDARCDQHALAMILFELLTGDPPYMGETSGAITVRIATAPPPSARVARPDVPPGLDAAIQRALAKRPEDRFPDVGDLAAAIAPFADPADRALAAAVRDILTLVPGEGFATSSTRDASTLPLLRPADTNAGLVTSGGGRRARSVGGVAGAIAAAALVVAGAAVWVTARAPEGAAVNAADATGSASDVPVATAPAAAAPSAPSAALVAVAPATSASAPPDSRSATSAPAGSASTAPAAVPPRPPPRRAPPARKPRSTDPTEVFGERTR